MQYHIMSCENEITRPKSNGHFSHQQRQILFLGHRAETKSRAEQQQQKQTELTYQDLTIKTPFVSLSIHQTETFLECVNLIKESETTKKKTVNAPHFITFHVGKSNTTNKLTN